MILLKSTTPGGKSQQCDARCYEGKGKSCACICGGINHGVGLARASINIGQTYDEWKAKGIDIHPFLAYAQPELPLMPEVIHSSETVVTENTPSHLEWKMKRRHTGYVKQELLEGFDSLS